MLDRQEVLKSVFANILTEWGAARRGMIPQFLYIYTELFNTYREALVRERQVKSWSRAKKGALIRGDMGELKRLSKRRTK